MTPIAPLITTFLREHLPVDRGYSAHTCDAYARTFQLLFRYASTRLGKQPCELMVEDLGIDMILSFLAHIEEERGNGASTRNARLAAIKAFMRYVQFRLPTTLAQARQIHAIPIKRFDRPLVQHLTMNEITAILDAPDIRTRLGLRDRAMLHLCFAGGLRVSELVSLPLASVTFHGTASVRVNGKGRRERCLPLWRETTSDLRRWISVRGDIAVRELFVNAQGSPMTRAGFEYVLEKHTSAAVERCPSLRGRSVTPHQLRHSCALIMLQATRDTRKVALWLGHADIRTTEMYLRVDPTEKLEAVEAVLPPGLRRGRFTAPDALIASLTGPELCGAERS